MATSHMNTSKRGDHTQARLHDRRRAVFGEDVGVPRLSGCPVEITQGVSQRSEVDGRRALRDESEERDDGPIVRLLRSGQSRVDGRRAGDSIPERGAVEGRQARGPEVGAIGRSGRRDLDREHEHGLRRQ